MRLAGYCIASVMSLIISYMVTSIVGMVMNSSATVMPMSYRIFMGILFVIFTVIGIRCMNELVD